jgi:hypothetical protein
LDKGTDDALQRLLDLAEENRSLSREVYFFLIFGAEDRFKCVELSEDVEAEVEGKVESKVDEEDVDGRSNRSTKKKSPTWSTSSTCTHSLTLPHTLLLSSEATKG